MANFLADLANISRNSYQGTPTLEKPAGQGDDIIQTLTRYSEVAGNVLDIFGGSKGQVNRTEPTSAPKPPGSAAAPATFFGIPRTIAIVAGLAVVGFFVWRKFLK